MSELTEKLRSMATMRMQLGAVEDGYAFLNESADLIDQANALVDDWCCFECMDAWPHHSVRGLDMQCPNGCGHLLRPSSQALRQAQCLVFDLLLSADGESSEKSRRYLERNRPDLHKRLRQGGSNG